MANFSDLASSSGCSPLSPPQVPPPPTYVCTSLFHQLVPPVGSLPLPLSLKLRMGTDTGCQVSATLPPHWWTRVSPTLSALVPASVTPSCPRKSGKALALATNMALGMLVTGSAGDNHFQGTCPVCQSHVGSCDPSSSEQNQVPPGLPVTAFLVRDSGSKEYR